MTRAAGLLRSPWAAPGAVAGITLLGLLVRLPGFLGYWLNPDEGIYYSAATWASWSRFWGEVASNAHPPLFFLLIRGVSALSLDFVALRSPSLVCGVLAIPALYLATRALLGTGAGLLAALLVALAPGAIVQSQVIRPYAMQVAVLGFALWFLARFASRRATGDLLGWGALLAVAILLHYGSLVVFAAAVGAAALLLASGRLGPRDALRLALAQAPALAALAALWLLHVSPRLVGGEHLQVARQGWLRPFFHHDPAGLWSGLVGLLRYAFGAPHDALALLVLALGLAVSVAERRVLLASLALLAIASAMALSWLALLPFGESRHSLYLLVVLVPCMAAGLRCLLVGRSWRHRAAAAVLALLVVHPQPLRAALGTRAAPSMAFVEHVTPRSAVERALPLLREMRARPGVVVMDEQTFYTLVPLFHPARLAMRTVGTPHATHLPRDESQAAAGDAPQGAALSRFRWDAADVLVSHAWRLRADARRPEREDHVLGFLRRADQAFPELGLAGRGAATLLFAGWGARFYAPLPALDRSRGGGCVASFELGEGFGWSRLAPARCLAGGSATP